MTATWSCTTDHVTEPCGDCSGCRYDEQRRAVGMNDPLPPTEPWSPPEGARPHPAKFSPEVIDALVQVIDAECERQERRLSVLDPFGGLGLIHEVAARLPERMLHVLAVELEPEWASQRPGVIVGDATDLAAAGIGDASQDVVATSPCYGNRMADTYMGGGPCQKCDGTGTVHSVPEGHPEKCPRCGGAGTDESKRMTYAVALGRRPSEGSAAVLQWGDRYRELHARAWTEADRVLRPGGLAVINISNHLRKGEVMRVVEWHLDWFLHHRYLVETVDRVGTRRYGFGANRDTRVDAERVLVLRKPA